MKNKFGLAVMFFALSSLVLGTGSIGSAFAAPGQGTLYGLISGTNELVVINPITGVASIPLQILDDFGTPGDFEDDDFIGFGTPALALDPTSGTLYLGT